MPEVELRIFTPRWGREDNYRLTYTRSELVVRSPARSATCTWRENLDPLWSGEDLLTVFEADAIYPPAVLPKMIEKAWRSWRGNELNDSELEVEMGLVAEWLNVTTKAKPSSEFWKGYF